MKKLIIILLMVFSIQLAKADHDRTPVTHHHYSSQLLYRNMDKDYQYCKYINYNGEIYMLYYHYTWDYKTYYNYEIKKYNPTENTYAELLETDNFTASFSDATQAAFFGYDNYLWFFDGIEKVHRFDLDTNKETIISSSSPYSGHTPSASCVLNNEIYVFYNNGSQLVADIFTYVNLTESKLEYKETRVLENADIRKNVSSAEVIAFSDNSLQIVYTTLDEYDGAVKVFSPDNNDNPVSIFTKTDLSDIKVATGSIGGEGETQQFDKGTSTETYSDRLSVFFVKKDSEKHKNKVYNKRCPIGFVQFAINNDNFYRIPDDQEFRVILSSDNYYAKDTYKGLIDITYNYVPLSTSNTVTGGVQKEIVLINNDKKYQTCLSFFKSDIYTVDPHDNVVVSNFISNEYTGINVEDFWILVGMTDGAPPAPINWDIWNPGVGNNEPTELVLSIESSKTCSTKVSSENSYTSETSLEGEIETALEPLKIIGGFNYKYASTNESVNDMENTQTIEISQSIGLNESSQEYAKYIYLVPLFYRYHFQLYPWWDKNNEAAVSGTSTYMTRAYSYTLKVVNKPLYAFPHNISHPNDSLMTEWKARDDNSAPNSIAFQAAQHGVGPVSATWSHGSAGLKVKLIEENVNTSEQSVSNSSEVELSGGLKIPDIFKFEESYSTEMKFTNTYTYSSTLTNSIEIDYSNIIDQENGIKCSGLAVDTYLFTSGNNENWWFYDSLPSGVRPWYIAYGVASIDQETIKMIQPYNGKQFYENGTVNFEWSGDLKNSKIFVSKSPDIQPENIVSVSDFNTNFNYVVNNLPAGKYYWRIAGIEENGQINWSEVQSFEMVPVDFMDNTLKTKISSIPMKVYPNPTSSNSTQISFELEKEEVVNIELFDVKGKLIWKMPSKTFEKGLQKISIPLDDLNGLGFIKLSSGRDVSFEKVMRLKD